MHRFVGKVSVSGYTVTPQFACAVIEISGVRISIKESGNVKLSIVFLVYNGGETIRRCLDSLFLSSRRPDQVIVIDDGFTDNSTAMASEYPCELFGAGDRAVRRWRAIAGSLTRTAKSWCLSMWMSPSTLTCSL